MQKYLILLSALCLLSSCEDVIEINTNAGQTQLVVDAWLNDEKKEQVVNLTLSQPYFDQSSPKSALGAVVQLSDNEGNVFEFKDLKNNGKYVLVPQLGKTFAKINNTYTLNIAYQGQQYSSTETLKRVPKIDSITYHYETRSIAPKDEPKEGFTCEFFARDSKGFGDTYHVRSYRNGKWQNQVQNLTVAYDAGFQEGSKIDGVLFILPIRLSVTPQWLNEKDTLKVELYSIPQSGYDYLFSLRQNGSNGGLLATPQLNLPCNVSNKDVNGTKPLGFFMISAMSSLTSVMDKKKAIVENRN